MSDVHCWHEGPRKAGATPADDLGTGSTCMLPDVHDGPHEFTWDDEIDVAFDGPTGHKGTWGWSPGLNEAEWECDDDCPHPEHANESGHLAWCMSLFGYSCDCGVEPRPPMSRAECENAKANHDDMVAEDKHA